jgi:hypothetical protein
VAVGLVGPGPLQATKALFAVDGRLPSARAHGAAADAQQQRPEPEDQAGGGDGQPQGKGEGPDRGDGQDR